jgi:hypothetical protein
MMGGDGCAWKIEKWRVKKRIKRNAEGTEEHRGRSGRGKKEKKEQKTHP